MEGNARYGEKSEGLVHSEFDFAATEMPVSESRPVELAWRHVCREKQQGFQATHWDGVEANMKPIGNQKETNRKPVAISCAETKRKPSAPSGSLFAFQGESEHPESDADDMPEESGQPSFCLRGKAKGPRQQFS